MSAQLVAIDDQQAQLKGSLTHHSGAKLLSTGESMIAKAASSGRWQVDLSGVEHSSSVGAALLLGWRRFAQSKGVQLVVVNTPENLSAVMRLSGVDRLFPEDSTD